MINVEDIKPNSHKYKADKQNVPEGYGETREKKVNKVISGNAKIKKKTDARRLADVFIAEDIANVKEYILLDVIVPTIKDTILNVVEMALFGKTSRSGSRRGPSEKVSYRSYYSDRDRDRDRSRDRDHGRNRFTYDDVTVPSRGEAEQVLTCMEELIEEYGHVTVADLYDLVGVTGEFTDYNYGWINLRNASTYRTRDGYAFKLPKAVPIRK